MSKYIGMRTRCGDLKQTNNISSKWGYEIGQNLLLSLILDQGFFLEHFDNRSDNSTLEPWQRIDMTFEVPKLFLSDALLGEHSHSLHEICQICENISALTEDLLSHLLVSFSMCFRYV
ncbi:hypothetical protein PMAYCL1PPCAC_09461, partial [Pristionchus mayeri]